MKKLWRYFLGLFPSKCETCQEWMLNKNKILMASADTVGVYYKGAGICMKCCNKKMMSALSGN